MTTPPPLGLVLAGGLARRMGGGDKARIKIAGTVVATKERITRTGSRMAWVRVSDASGSVEITCFSEVLGRSREVLSSGSNVLVCAELKTEGEAVRVTATDVMPLDQAAASAGASIRVWLRESAAVPHIRDILGRESGGRGRVTLMPRIGSDQDVEIALPGGFKIGPEVLRAVRGLRGVLEVQDL